MVFQSEASYVPMPVAQDLTDDLLRRIAHGDRQAFVDC